MKNKATPQDISELRQASDVLNGKRYISDLEVSATYSIPRKTLQNWRIMGRGPKFRKFGSSVRYNVAELERYFEGLPAGGEGVPASALRSA